MQGIFPGAEKDWMGCLKENLSEFSIKIQGLV